MYINILEKNNGDIKYRKKGCQLSKQAYKWRANEGLYHLLAILGYKVDNINSTENNIGNRQNQSLHLRCMV